MPICLPADPRLANDTERKVWRLLCAQLGERDLLIAGQRVTDHLKDHKIDFGSASAGVDCGRKKFTSAVKAAMSPELINRIDELVVFDPLSPEAGHRRPRTRISGRATGLEPPVYELRTRGGQAHAKTGYDQTYGTRHLHRNIERRFVSLIVNSVHRWSVSAFLMESLSSMKARNYRRPLMP